MQSAITPGFFGSSSGSLKTIFMRSAPMSAILVKIPPQMRSALAPRLSPIAKPMKQGPTSAVGRNTRMQIMKKSSTETSNSPTLMPLFSGIPSTGSEAARKLAKAARLFAVVLIRIPNHATPYDPRIPSTLAAKIMATSPPDLCSRMPK